MKKFLLDENKGFTLIEVMLATLILVVGVIPLLDTSIYATKNYAEAKEETRLLNFAKMKMEEIKAMPFSAKKSGYLDSGIKYEVAINDYEAIDAYCLRKIDVSVYPEGKKSEKEIKLTTLVKVDTKK